MSHGIRRKARKLQKFLDNGGIILKLKFKGKPNDRLDQRFFTIDQNIKPIIKDDRFYKLNNHYWAPILDIHFKNDGDGYCLGHVLDAYCPLSKVRYMLVKYSNGLIKTIWI
jgi:hypothetical protein